MDGEMRQGEHRPGEEGLKRIVAGEPGITRHVAERIDLHEKADDGHQGEHEQAHGVEQIPEGDVKISCNEPSDCVLNGLSCAPVSDQ